MLSVLFLGIPTICPRTGYPTLPQIETLGFSHHCVRLLTHAVSRHVSHHTQSSLAFSRLACHRARARACARTRTWVRRGIYALGLRASHAGGLSCMGLCVCLGVGVQAVLGPLRARFGLVLIQTGKAELFRCLSNEYQSEANVCVKGGQI